MISPRRQIELTHRRSHQTLTILLQSAKLPYLPDTQWKQDPVAWLEKYFPGITEGVEAWGEHLEELAKMWGFTYWSIDKAKQLLGYSPKHNFPEFYEALKQRDEGYYPYANLPWWGV